jgi:hypothetical protein
MSRLQQRLYLAIWEMWTHRNQLLHGAGDRIHSSTLATIDTDIHSEWKRGIDTLPLRYVHLFSGKLEKILQLSPQDKQRWLTSIWAARDKQNGGIQLWDRTSNIDYDKWKAKRTPIPQSTTRTTQQQRQLDRPQPLTILTTDISDEETPLSDDECTSGKGNTPKASYAFTQDTEFLTVAIPTPSSPSSPCLAQTPTGATLLHPPLQEYITISSIDNDTVHHFRRQSIPHALVISQFHQQTVSFGSLLTTNPGTWFNDEVINFYLSILNQYDHTQKENTQNARHHFFNSFFITCLLDEGNSNSYKYQNVLRWSRKVFGSDLFQLHKIFFPCNISRSHWSCVIADIQTSTIIYYDSMRGNGDKYMNSILHYLQDDWMRTRGFHMPNLRQWTLKNEQNVPVQDNSYDCGTFVCMFATCMALGCRMDFTQTDAPAMRLKLAHMIIRHSINPLPTTRPHTSNTSQDECLITDHNDQQSDSQDSTLPLTTQTTQNQASPQHTGYYTITQGLVQNKRKHSYTQGSHRKKRRKTNVSQLTKTARISETSSTSHQLRLSDMLTATQNGKGKRKITITDEEHPFKHKRYKEDGDT